MRILVSKVDLMTPKAEIYSKYRVGILSNPVEAQKIIIIPAEAEALFGTIEGDEAVYPDFIADIICFLSSRPDFGQFEVHISIDKTLIIDFGNNAKIELKESDNSVSIYSTQDLQTQASILLQFFHDILDEKAVLFYKIAQTSIFDKVEESAETEESDGEVEETDEPVEDMEQEEAGETEDFETEEREDDSEDSPLMDAVSSIEKEYMETSETKEKVEEKKYDNA